MTGVMRTALILLASILTFTGIASAQQLSRADAVAQALASNPTVKLSLEQVALLEGRIVEARADALPDITWNTGALRLRDPALLNSPGFDSFPPEFRDCAGADSRQCLFDGGRYPADRSSASSWGRRSRPRASHALPAIRTPSGRGR